MQHQLFSEHLNVVINHFGAELVSIKNKAGHEHLWQANPQVWARHAPVLFPIVGKLKENKFVFNEKEYNLPQHGFARDSQFTLIRKENASCVFELKPHPETKNKYPFDFVFRITYRLDSKKITTSYQVFNPSLDTIYFSVGGHPGFNCPVLSNEKFEDYYLEFENEMMLETEMKNGLISEMKTPMRLINKRLKLSTALFEKEALVFENSQIDAVHLCSSVSGTRISIDCKGWPYFGIWAKPGCRDFICLEPWHGIADRDNSAQELTEKEGIICLDPGKEFNCNFSISII